LLEDVYTDEWLDVVEWNLDEHLDWTEGDEVYFLVGKKYLDAEDRLGRSLRGLLNESPPDMNLRCPANCGKTVNPHSAISNR
jgi:hypothetical protein